MRITSEHYEHLAAAVKPLMTAERYAAYQEQKLSFTRFIFDCMYQAGRQDSTLTTWVCDVLYMYMDDSHITTALRHMAKEVGLADYD